MLLSELKSSATGTQRNGHGVEYTTRFLIFCKSGNGAFLFYKKSTGNTQTSR